MLGEVEFERAARPPRFVERGEGTVERRDPLRRHRQPVRMRIVMCLLHRIIGQPRRRAHDRPLEPMMPLAAGGVDPQLRGDASAVGRGNQRAEVVRQRLRQHRHDPVGKVDRVAAPRRLAVEGATRRHVSGDIGDRDDDMPTAGIGRIVVGLRPDRVVEIARVAAVDRDQLQLAQVGAAGGVGRRGRRCLGQRLGWKFVRDVESGDRHPADRTRRIGCTEPLDDADPLAVEAAGRHLLGDDQLVVGEPRGVVAEHPVFATVAAIGRDHLAAVAATPEYADDALACAVDPAQDLGFDLTRFASDQAGRRALSRRKLLAGRADQPEEGRVAGA